MSTLSNVETQGGELDPSSVKFTLDTIPEAKNVQTGVSVRYAHDPHKKWYVFRVSYRREDKASDYLVEDGIYTYIAKKIVEKYVGGKRKRYLQTHHFELDDQQKNPPLTISCSEMENFIRATITKNEHLFFVKPSQCHYKSGEQVQVIDGPFMGVQGKVARVSGQQRVIITLSQFGLISTAYIPSAFIEKVDQT